MSLKMFLTLLLCYAALMSASVPNVPAKGALTGVITDSNGAIIPEATIRVQHWVFDQYMQHPREKCDGEFYTNAKGRFNVALQPGDYDVFIAYPSMSPVAKKVEIKNGKTTELNRELKIDPLTKVVE